jgi:exopolysaccharide biosynthesis polyprenyl glycosylphosphotransferase
MLETQKRSRAASAPRSGPTRFPRRRLPSVILDARSPAGIRGREALNRAALATADVVAALLAVLGAGAVFGENRIPLEALALLPLVLLAGKVSGLYDRDDVVLSKATLDETPALFQLATLYALLVTVLSSAILSGGLGAREVVGLWVAFFVALVVCRWAVRTAVRALARPERCLCLGERPAAIRLGEMLDQDRRTNAEVVGVAALRSDGLANLVERLDVHRVIVSPGAADGEAVLEVVRMAKALGVRVSIFPRLFEVVGSSVRFDQVSGMTMLGVRRFGLTRSSEVVKRGFDLAGASLLLLVFAPVLLVAALAIKLDSRGPVLFRQLRVGRDGQPFEILKFRTMVADAESRKDDLRDLSEGEGLFKIERDPRITRVGRLLRRTSLDELPQLVNVVRGEMSLVGPRPLVLEEDRQIQGWQRRRLHLTPGVTGHWQILGSARIPLQEMVKIDYLYVANWSLWVDVKILLRTVTHVLTRQGM